MPHARVRSIDTSAAKKMKGVVAILTAKEVPSFPPPSEPILTNEPRYIGEPILAVAAVDEHTAGEAIAAIKLEMEPLPFTVDPLESLYPRGPNARQDGNVANVQLKLQTVKWTAKDFAAAGDKKLPMGKPAEHWSFGDVEKGFKDAKLVIEETFVTAGYPHHSMEPRTAMAYWQNGKCVVHGSSQSQAFIYFGLARYIGIKPQDLIYVAEFCGGGFGSKGTPYPIMAVPALMSKKTGRPVQMRISRAEEYAVGSGRPGFQGWVKIGYRADGRVTACDMYVVHENGPHTGFWDFRNAGHAFSVSYQPLAMRWRGISVLTNTPARGPQRGPGENQIAAAIEPMMDMAARKLGIDRLAIRMINAPGPDGRGGHDRHTLTSSYMKEALQKAAKMFNWDEKKKQSGRKNGSKVIGVGIGQAFHQAGFNGFDGMVRITPDGKVHIHTGVGNLGTYSYAGTARAAAEGIGAKWENCVIERGDTRKGTPFMIGQFGSNTTFTATRSNWAAAQDTKKKLQEIAAKDLGGKPEDYETKDGRVFLKSNPSKGMTFAKAAQRAIALGGAYSGKKMPEDINPITKGAVAAFAGTGLIGVAKDKLAMKGIPPGLSTSFVRIELDTETGRHRILDMVTVSDCGTVVHPMSLHNQLCGGSIMGIGMATTERYVFDPHLGIPGNVGLDTCKPPTYLDAPMVMNAGGVDKPDPYNPVGAKGVGEPPMGAAAAAMLSAISDAMGGHLFNRTPVVPDMIINVAAGKPPSRKLLAVNTQ
jgi:xanthine dehydrogenase molybdenum-binding subunit